jgi:hypothetical protein
VTLGILEMYVQLQVSLGTQSASSDTLRNVITLAVVPSALGFFILSNRHFISVCSID